MSFRNLGLISKLSWLDLKKASGWRWSCKIIKYRFYPSQASEITNLKSLNLHSRILSAVNVSSRISISNFWNRHERSLSSLSLSPPLSPHLSLRVSLRLSLSLSPPLSLASLSPQLSLSQVSLAVSLSLTLFRLCFSAYSLLCSSLELDRNPCFACVFIERSLSWNIDGLARFWECVYKILSACS